MKNSFSSAFPSPSLHIWNWIMSIFCFRRRGSSKTTSWSLWNCSSFHLCLHLLCCVLTFDKKIREKNPWKSRQNITDQNCEGQFQIARATSLQESTILTFVCSTLVPSSFAFICCTIIICLDLCLFYPGPIGLHLCLHLLRRVLTFVCFALDPTSFISTFICHSIVNNFTL